MPDYVLTQVNEIIPYADADTVRRVAAVLFHEYSHKCTRDEIEVTFEMWLDSESWIFIRDLAAAIEATFKARTP